MTKNSKEHFICVLPWNHVFISNQGHFHPCCLSQADSQKLKFADGKIGQALNEKSIHEARSSPDLIHVRQVMLAGGIPKDCSYCHNIEGSGKRSYRTHVNSLFPNTHELIKSFGQATEVLPIEFVDIRFGNLCNLKCRMCHPTSSVGLQNEFNIYFGTKTPESFELAQNVLTTLTSTDSTIRRINIAGGEPFLMKSVHQFVKDLSQLDQAKEMTLTFNSNLTQLDFQFMNMWKSFKRVEVSASVDGIGSLNEYIRYPSDWKVISQNINVCRQYAYLYINCTVQNYNIFYLDEILEYFRKQHHIDLNFNMLDNPDYHSIQALPMNLKESAAIYIQALARKYSERTDLAGLCQFMYQADKSLYFSQFINWTEYLDRNRKQSFLEVIPAFKGWA